MGAKIHIFVKTERKNELNFDKTEGNKLAFCVKTERNTM